jgi:rare lipoprotein A
MMLRRLLISISGVVLALGLSGCWFGPPEDSDSSLGKGIYKLGQPYQINGAWYYPSDDFGYDETGIAALYGDVDEQFTANGERFDQNVASGAHRTLAMPTIVQVTNLDNGRSIQLRINDRGPTAPNRILSMSRRAGQLLGFGPGGTAKVEVKVLVPETMQVQSLAKLNSGEATAGPAPPPAVPHEAIIAETLPPPGSNAQPQPIRPAPAPPPRVEAAIPPAARSPEQVKLFPVHQTQIFIQAGAFASGANAQKMKARLDALGAVNIAATRVNGLDIYRVRLGPIPSIDEADRLLARAVSAGASDAKIVID